MKKIIEDRGDVLAVRAKPDDAVARLQRCREAIRSRLSQNQELTNADRDLLLLAVAQTLGVLS